MLGRIAILALLIILNPACLRPANAEQWIAGECTTCKGFAELHHGCSGDGLICDGCCGCGNRWTATAEFIWLGRSRGNQRTLFVADVGGGLTIPVLDVDDLAFDVRGGVRTGIELETEAGRKYEIGYFGVFDQTVRQSIDVAPATPVTYNFFGVVGGTTTVYDVEYQSDLHSGEANVRFPEYLGFEPLVGLRWMYLGEQLEFIETATPAVGALGEIRNNLIGAQIGVDTHLWGRGRRLRVLAGVKAGVFQNGIDLYADTHTAAGPVQSLSRTFEEAATTGEVHLTMVWQPIRCVAFRAGYSGLWMSGVGTVANQIGGFNLATGAGTLRTSSIDFHGGHLGFEVTW